MTDYSKHEIETALLNTATNPEFSDALKDYAELGIAEAKPILEI